MCALLLRDEGKHCTVCEAKNMVRCVIENPSSSLLIPSLLETLHMQYTVCIYVSQNQPPVVSSGDYSTTVYQMLLYIHTRLFQNRHACIEHDNRHVVGRVAINQSLTLPFDLLDPRGVIFADYCLYELNTGPVRHRAVGCVCLREANGIASL